MHTFISLSVNEIYFSRVTCFGSRLYHLCLQVKKLSLNSLFLFEFLFLTLTINFTFICNTRYEICLKMLITKSGIWSGETEEKLKIQNTYLFH